MEPSAVQSLFNAASLTEIQTGYVALLVASIALTLVGVGVRFVRKGLRGK